MGFIYGALRSIMEWIHSGVGSYAITIMIFTILMRLVLLPLDYKSRSSMRKTTKLQPKIDEINRKYANDPEKKNQKTMELYQKEKINPLGGCLPMLLQMPIFIVLFGAVRMLADEQAVLMFQTVARTGAFVPESFLWVRNIWQPDNILDKVIPAFETFRNLSANGNSPILTAEAVEAFKNGYETVIGPIAQLPQFQGVANGWAILPILAGGLQILQTRFLTPQTQQPATQQGNSGQMMKMMNYIFPLMFVYFCWTSSAVFSLYWVTSSLFAIAEQFVFNKYFERRDREGNTSLAETRDGK